MKALREREMMMEGSGEIEGNNGKKKEEGRRRRGMEVPKNQQC